MTSNANYDVAIIGAGPGGLTAAIYLKRAGLSCIMFEGDTPGGSLNRTHKIENYPGFTDKDGTVLAFRMYSQALELDVSFKTEKVINIEKDNNLYNVITNNGTYNTKYIIIATGKTPRKLDLKDAEKFESKGISYCAICDGVLYKNKNIAIVGGGNSAMEAASYMKDIASKIYIINRSSVLRADKKEQNDVINSKNVEVIYDSKITRIIGEDDKITSVEIDNKRKLDVSGIFVCIGQESNFAFYQNLNLKTDNLGIIVDKDMKTSIEGVYACGDCISKNLYQVVTATSEGAVAATSIIKDIKKRNESN